MRVKSVKIREFRRFHDLEIKNIPETARLVVLAGPNGSGKSSLFDAFLLMHRLNNTYSWINDKKYYIRSNEENSVPKILSRISVKTNIGENFGKDSLYIRSPYRNDPDFELDSLSRQGDILGSHSISRMIDTDSTVKKNYARLASQAMVSVFVNEDENTKIGDFREKFIGDIRNPLMNIFNDLVFQGIGDPLDKGSFVFSKGDIKNFDYRNLSGGEKAVFDLILDLVVKRNNYSNAIYCIDEPENHMNTRLQSLLLEELINLIPEESQLWISSHSIGMMRKALELYKKDPNTVVFLDFNNRDFDKKVVIEPSRPTRKFWEEIMNVALDDISELIAPSSIVICEGSPKNTENSDHDSKIYAEIFSDEYPDTKFISAGSANDVKSDFLGIASILPKILSGIKIIRLIDGDDHSEEDILDLRKRGIVVLRRRNIESYIYDDEVLFKLCNDNEKSDKFDEVIKAKEKSLADSISRGNPEDDFKKASSEFYLKLKKILKLNKSGNDSNAFARNILSKLIDKEMKVYKELKEDIFG